MTPQGTIVINLEGITFGQIERCRSIIHTLFEQGIFNVKSGNVTLHFDPDGNLQEIEFHVKKWRRSKPEKTLQEIYESATIEVVRSPSFNTLEKKVTSLE